MPFGAVEREILKNSYTTMTSIHRPRGKRLVRTRITRPTGAHCVLGVKLLCRLSFEADCADLILSDSFKSPVTREKYRHATFEVSIIPRSADLEFAAYYRGQELARVQADYAENLRDTEV